MYIVFLQDDFPPKSFGGAGISVYELALGMKKEGHEVSVITTCRTKKEEGESTYHGLQVFKIQSNYHVRWRWYISLYNGKVVKKVERILKDLRPDVVHANNIHFHLSYHCLKLARKYAKVVVITFRDVMSFNFAKLTTQRYLNNLDCHTTWRDHIRQARKRWNPFRNRFIKKYLKYTDVRVAVSESLQKALEQNGIKQVEVIHTGIDASAYEVPQDAVADFRSKYGIENKKVLLFAGRLSETKGGRKAVNVLSEIVSKFPDTVLLVAGAVDVYAEEMKREAERRGIGDKLIFTGWIAREEMKAAYATSDIVLTPSIYLDPFPRTVLEAMASKKPVIATRYGGAAELVQDKVTGYIVDPRNEHEIAQKVIDLVENTKRAAAFEKTGYDRVKKFFNLEDKVKEYIAMYESLLKEK